VLEKLGSLELNRLTTELAFPQILQLKAQAFDAIQVPTVPAESVPTTSGRRSGCGGRLETCLFVTFLDRKHGRDQERRSRRRPCRSTHTHTTSTRCA
jgi:hypothetical protein